MAKLSSHYVPLDGGDWVGEYEIIRRLRAGGMATLFLGRRHGAAGFTKLAAIKIVHPHLVYDPRFVKMFVDEARICSQISHPNVVHVEAFGEEGGLHYLVMEYVNGCSIAQLLRMLRKEDRKLPVDVAVQVAMQVSSGLHGAHEASGPDGDPLCVIHRDISPANVLLSRDGHVKIIDFGIAKAKGRLALTDTGHALKGKLKYMAPEQARVKDIDRRADLYALGVVTWELLTGTQLFPEDGELALIGRLENSEVRKPTEINPEIPKAVEDAVLKALSLNPDDRQANCREYRRELAQAMPEALQIEAIDIGTLVCEVLKKVPDPAKEAASIPPRSKSESTMRLAGEKDELTAPELEIFQSDGSSMGSTVGSSPAKKLGMALGAVAILALGLLGGKLIGAGDDAPATNAAVANSNIAAAPAAKTVAPEPAVEEPVKAPDAGVEKAQAPDAAVEKKVEEPKVAVKAPVKKTTRRPRPVRSRDSGKKGEGSKSGKKKDDTKKSDKTKRGPSGLAGSFDDEY